MPLVGRTSVVSPCLPLIGSEKRPSSMLDFEPDRHQNSTAAGEALVCRIVVAGAHGDPRAAARDMVAGLAGPAEVDIAAGAERGLGRRTIVVVAGRTHSASLHLAYCHFAYTHPVVVGVEEHGVASGPAPWMLVRTSSACEAGSSGEEEETWTRSWSAIDPGEGQRRRCWRKRHLVGNSRSFRIHRDGGHRTGLADSLPFYLPTLIRGQSLSRGCVYGARGPAGTPTPRRRGEPPRPQVAGSEWALYVAVDADGLPSYVTHGLVPATRDDAGKGDRSGMLRSKDSAALATPDNTDGWPQGEKPR